MPVTIFYYRGLQGGLLPGFVPQIRGNQIPGRARPVPLRLSRIDLVAALNRRCFGRQENVIGLVCSKEQHIGKFGVVRAILVWNKPFQNSRPANYHSAPCSHKTCNFSALPLLSAIETGLQSRWVVNAG
jgi:hypothetical protein